jgi:hypothetical protein
VLPDTTRPPTLVFDSATAAHSDDPTNTTTWTIRLGRATLTGIEGPTTAVAEDQPTQAAAAATRGLLTSSATWRINGPQLLVQGTTGASLTYTKDATAALALGGVDVRLLARGYQPYPIPGSVVLTLADRSPSVTRRVSVDVLRIPRLAPGLYRVSATVTAGSCTPRTVKVTGGDTASLDVACLLDNRPPPGPPTGAAIYINADHEGSALGCGKGATFGHVVARDRKRAIVWQGTVTPYSRQPTLLPPGRYTLTASVTDGACSPFTVTIVAHHTSVVMITCKQGVATG